MLGANQASMDGTIKTGKVLMDKSPPDDSIMIEGKIADLKARWDVICALSVERLVIIYSSNFTSLSYLSRYENN